MEKNTVAKNGIPIYSYPNPAQNSFFISLFLRSGSMYESAEESGITHFLEHIAIRNINHAMGGELYALLDKCGIEFNAATYSEMVQFYITGAKDKLRIGADIISKLLLPISLPRAEIDAERDRIRAEIREVDDKSSLGAFTAQQVWEGSSLSGSITGSAATVRRVNLGRLEEYRQRVFSRHNLFLYVTGGVSDADIAYLSEVIGGYTLPSSLKHENIAPRPASFGNRGGVYVKNADFTKVRFTLDVDMSQLTLPELDILYEQLLGGYSSDFFIELSEHRGLFYDLSGSTERYANIGVLWFTYELRESKLYEALEMTVDILKKFTEEPIPRAKFMTASYVDNAMMLYDDARELNFTFAYDNHIIGCGYTDLASRRAAYERVTPERIREVAARIFKRENLTLTLKGNKKRIDEERIKDILSRL